MCYDILLLSCSSDFQTKLRKHFIFYMALHLNWLYNNIFPYLSDVEHILEIQLLCNVILKYINNDFFPVILADKQRI